MALSTFYLNADIQPPETFRAESLLATLADGAAGRRMLLVRASRGRKVLAEGLAAAGAQVSHVIAYDSRDVQQIDPWIAERIRQVERLWITATSSAIAKAAVPLLHDSCVAKPHWVSISPVTSQSLRDLGVEPAAEAEEATLAGIVDAIRRGVEAS
jgi:uroporphyrinogen III methyltransferase/synthase